MKLFKLIEIDLDAERARIDRVDYNDRQRKALHKLLDLFEAGDFQACLDHVNDDESPDGFPYNIEEGYHEVEHIPSEISDVLWDLQMSNYYTSDQLLKEAEEKLKATKPL